MVTITLRDPKLHLLTEEEAKMLHVCADLEGSAEFDFTVNFEVKSGDGMYSHTLNDLLICLRLSHSEC